MTMDNNIRAQRNRFLAFSFATSDLLLEISEEGTISYALGSLKSLVKTSADELIGRTWLELFDESDRGILLALRTKAKSGERCGPILVTLNDEFKEGRQVVFSGIKMPDKNQFFVTLSMSNVLMAKIGDKTRQAENQTLLSKEQFLEAAKEAMDMAGSIGQETDLTLLDINNLKELESRFGEEQFENLREEIATLLRKKSVDGETAAEIGKGRYSVIHDKDISAELIQEEIERLSQQQDPTGVGFEVTKKTVDSDLSGLSEKETSRALLYTIQEFERKGTDLTIDSLNNSFKAYLSANAQKIVELKDTVERMNFRLYFQPIVSLETGELHHYEMLSRFPDGQSTYEWVVFAEDTGMANLFDMAVCERAINYLTYKSPGRNTQFSLNLSGQSISSPEFFEELIGKLNKAGSLGHRLHFEITESTGIEDLSLVNDHIEEFHKHGYQVSLDDFGAGSASFQYLQKLNVDYVKIDGAYTRKLLTSERDASMIKNLVRMCKDLNIKTVAEFVEEPEQASMLRNMGVDYGQGYLYSEPLSQPNYKP